jgi:hypothetical protein
MAWCPVKKEQGQICVHMLMIPMLGGVPRHHGTALPQVADGGEGVAANTLNKSRTADKG